jgi:transcriptional regulator with XRE-family HTH domain
MPRDTAQLDEGRQAPEDLSSKVGERLRDIRKRSNIKLAELASLTGISIGTISQLERGLASPTVRTIFTISSALGISPARLLDPEIESREAETEYVVRSGRGRALIETEALRKYVISPESSSRLKTYYMVLSPGGSSGNDAYSHSGEETGYVLAGSFDLTVGGETLKIAKGDCFAFSSQLEHRFHNPGSEQAIVLWINYSTT